MKRLLFFALVVFAGWYGYHHYRELLHHQAMSKAVIVNSTGHELTRVRLSAGEQSIGVKESIPDNGRTEFPFHVDHDATFVLVWQYGDRAGESHWTGGTVTSGPVAQKCTFTIDGDGEVLFLPENLSPTN
ncbi:MAG: hypothetical protein ACRENS_07380 [Candidatus Eiseniibacteriota bacterium]